MKQNKRNIIIIGIIIAFFIVLILTIFINKETIKELGEKIKKQLSASIETTIIDYDIMNIDGENMELLFVAENENGVEKIVLPDMELYGKRKRKVAFDRKLKEGDVYQLKIEEDNKQEMYTFLATTKPKILISSEDVLGDGTTVITRIEYPNNDNITKYYSVDDGETWQVYTGEINVPREGIYNMMAKIEWNEGKTINKPVKYTEFIYVEHDEENTLRTITISYNENYTNGTTKYYRIGETREWKEYTGPITLNDSDIDLNDIKEGTNKLVIYAKQTLDDKDISMMEHEETITTTVKLDVFNDMRVSGKTLSDYGFTASWVKKEIASFTIGCFEAGHSSGAASWSGTFNWNSPKTYGATSLYVDFYQLAQLRGGRASSSQTRVTAYYNDGTNTRKQNATLTGTIENPPYIHYPTEIELNSDDINYIQFYLNGSDLDYSYSKAKLTGIVLKGIQLPVTE